MFLGLMQVSLHAHCMQVVETERSSGLCVCVAFFAEELAQLLGMDEGCCKPVKVGTYSSAPVRSARLYIHASERGALHGS